MVTTRIAVLVSGGGTNLQALIDAEQNGILKSGTIALVISNRADAYALVRAEQAKIATQTILRKDPLFEEKLLSALQEAEIDLIVLAGFTAILSAEFLRHYPERVINVHPSLIPAFCGKGYYGLKVHEAALAKGVKLTGATVHYVNEIPDGGKIIAQKAVRVYENDSPERLQKRVMKQAEWVILPQAVEQTARHLGALKEEHESDIC